MSHSVILTNEKGLVVAVDEMIEMGNSLKIKRAKQKLFSISEDHPLAIVSLGTDFFINYPVPQLVKMFADSIKEKFLKETVDYVDHFIFYMEELDMIDLEEGIEERNYIYGFMKNRLEHLHEQIQAISHTRVEQLLTNNYEEEIAWFLQQELTRLENKQYLPNFSNEDYRMVELNYKEEFEELVSKLLDEKVLNETTRALIKQIIIQALLKDINPFSTSFLFIGYGEKEMSPTICELHIEGRVNQKLKFSITLNKMDIGDVVYSGIQPFGHAKTPLTNFTNGIASSIETNFHKRLEEGATEAASLIIEKLKDEAQELSDDVPSIVNDSFHTLVTSVKESFEAQKYQLSEKLIYQNINRLSLTQLAFHAEQLLQLADLSNVLQQNELSPIGISVNVALIDKVDGFTLVK